jgi:methionyl-tRNA formyltransferase
VKVLFFGSSDFSVPFIEAINDSCHNIVLVLTSDDKAKGRGKIISPNPVKICAQKLHLDYLEDPDFSEQTMEKIAGTCFDCLVVVSFGRLIPKKILEIAGGRTINVHPSLLPKYRGPSPITTALLNGDTQTGISLIKIEEKFDIGDVYAQLKLDISENDNRDLLEAKIFKLGAPFLISLLDNFESMSFAAHPQSVQGVSYTKIFKKEDFKIDWSKNADEIFNKIRAFSSTPGSVTLWRGKYLKIFKARIVELPQSQKDEIIYSKQRKDEIVHAGQNRDAIMNVWQDKDELLYSGQGKEEVIYTEQHKYARIYAGQVIKAEKTGLLVACGSSILKPDTKTPLTVLSLLVIKPQGKEKMHFTDFINGYRIKAGDSFEQ